MTPSIDSPSLPLALVMLPEVPYPVAGGGPLRTACLLQELARHFTLDLVAFHDPAWTAPAQAIPRHLYRRLCTITLPHHSRQLVPRLSRNLRRALAGVPALVDRFAGHQHQLAQFIAGQRYRLGWLEHAWLMPYQAVLRPACQAVWLDLHNVESVLEHRAASSHAYPRRWMHQRFAQSYRRLERHWLPRMDQLLVTSSADAEFVHNLLSKSLPTDVSAAVPPTLVIPNAIPWRDAFATTKRPEIVFSGNLAYEPNRQGVLYFLSADLAPGAAACPQVRWRVIGKNPDAVASIAQDARVTLTGWVDDAVAEIAQAQVSVVPLLAGSGTRMKILEAWAATTAVVSTTIGAEGLPPAFAGAARIADPAPVFAQAVIDLLQQPAACAPLAAAGRQAYEQQYHWGYVQAQLTGCLQGLLVAKPDAPP